MRILNLYFKNINSLEGEHRIHFDKAPISEAGVFAITGQNGSGKSSILDVITLGLYGETFRFDRPAEFVITKNYPDCFAQVEFSLGDNVYRSSWQFNPADSDQATMLLIDLNDQEKTIAEGTIKVRKHIAELSGMDFHKFTKSMILAQGDFAAFLNALDSERMDILEKISGEEFYTSKKMQIESAYAEAESQRQLLQQDLNAIPIMDQAQTEAQLADLSDFKDQKKEIQQELDSIESRLAASKKHDQLDTEINQLSDKNQLLEQEIQECNQVLNEIEQIPDLSDLEKQFKQNQSNQAQHRNEENQFEAATNEIESLKNQLEQLKSDNSESIPENVDFEQQKAKIEELKIKVSDLNFIIPKEKTQLQSLNQQLIEKEGLFKNVEKWLEHHPKAEQLLQPFPDFEEIKVIRSEIAELDENLNGYRRWIKKNQETLSSNQATIKSLSEKNNDLSQQIETNTQSLETMAEGYQLPEINELIEEQKERCNQFKELTELAQVNAKLGKKGLISQLLGSRHKGKEIEELQQKADQMQMQIGREENIFHTLEQTVKTETLLKKMQEDRTHLSNGKPCPLCGALKHPYSEHPPAVSNSDQALLDQQKKLREVTDSFKSLNKQIVSLKKLNEKEEAKESQLQQIQSDWKRLANKLNIASPDFNIDDVSEIKALQKNEKEELSKLNYLKKKFSKQLAGIDSFKADIETNIKTIQRTEIETTELEEEINKRIEEEKTLQEAYSTRIAKETELTQQINAKLEQLGESMPTHGNEDTFLSQLETKKQEFQTQLNHQKTFAEEITQLEQQIQTSSDNITKYEKEVSDYSQQLKSDEHISLHLELKEKQQELELKQAEIEKLNNTLADNESRFKAALENNNIQDSKQLQETIEFVKQKSELENKLRQLEGQLAQNQQRHEQLQSDLDALTNEQHSYSEEEVLALETQLKEQLDIASQEIQTIENKIKRQDSLKQKHTELNQKLESHQAVYENCQKEMELIQAENKHAFKQYIQNLLAEKLFSESNQVLEKISGRYYVRRVESEHGLALEIEDTKQQNARRLPKTLSGGESFIVSLALALALADMSNKDHALESLFLDEGFGNLDAESLYSAMTTLESLKTHGKAVGIISHVEGVKKRIKTQIEMTKKTNGLSSVKMVS